MLTVEFRLSNMSDDSGTPDLECFEALSDETFEAVHRLALFALL